MITYGLPDNKTRFLPCSVRIPFILNLNIPNGTYQCNSTEYTFFPIQKNCQYLFERMSVTVNCPEDDFQNALGADIPQIKFFKKLSKADIFLSPFPVVSYMRDRDVSVFVDSNEENEIRVSMAGTLYQTSNLVGISILIFNIIGNIFLMDSNVYNKFMRDEVKRF